MEQNAIYELNNTVYIATQNTHLRLSNENLVVELPDQPMRYVPLHHLSSIVLLGNIQVSTPLIAHCAHHGIDIVWCDSYGRFRARLEGMHSGSVWLRKAQHDALNDPDRALAFARRFVAGKIANQSHVMQRHIRDYADAAERLQPAVASLDAYYTHALQARTMDALRGVEGSASRVYFGHFDALIRNQRDAFRFQGRNRRPPADRTNALLSFFYTLHAQEHISALCAVGLDPNVGLMHALRAGRPALALDLMEEMRPAFIDRFVLRLINTRQIQPDHFDFLPHNAVYLNDAGRRVALHAYQERRREQVSHPDAAQPVPWGVVPHLQARRLARALRDPEAAYEPYQIR
ncbi:MAG: type I-C CRISPR-associated endonuclease Cas1c [Fimbriimonadales bacterium]|nr:MAG: CRISPR-associated endonuclease Cas1 1 [Fimbriimonadales bacterium]